MTKQEMAQEALTRARSNLSLSNYPAIFAGLIAKGIPENDIEPRVNVLTYRAWQALGRQVERGEKGVKICTWIERDETVTDPKTGKEEVRTSRIPRTASVFHISQTKETTGPEVSQDRPESRQ